MYRSTNPWGVTFDDWGQHVASHPIFASAFHATNPPYPKLHPRPAGIPAYSGTCGQEFIDMASFPDELQGGFVKVRYKPTNRVEIHKWHERADHFAEEYTGDILFSSNLSFIPVDVRFGPRGALYVLDWYNPVKGHSQYSLRDERRDRKSGRVWRITAKGRPLVEPPKIAGAPLAALFGVLERREYRYRYWAKREIRNREPVAAQQALVEWLGGLKKSDPRFRHHQVEAMWMYRNLEKVNIALLRELIGCEEHHARGAATRQLRYWHEFLPDAIELLGKAAADANGLVRLEAAIAASYIGSAEALQQALKVLDKPRTVHLNYALACSLGSRALRRPLGGQGGVRRDTGVSGEHRQEAETAGGPFERERRAVRWPAQSEARRDRLCCREDEVHGRTIRSAAEPAREARAQEHRCDGPQSSHLQAGDFAESRYGCRRDGP